MCKVRSGAACLPGENGPVSAAVGLRRRLLSKNGPVDSGTGAIHQERLRRSRFRAPCVSAGNAATHPESTGPFLLSRRTAAQCRGYRSVFARKTGSPRTYFAHDFCRLAVRTKTGPFTAPSPCTGADFCGCGLAGGMVHCHYKLFSDGGLNNEIDGVGG